MTYPPIHNTLPLWQLLQWMFNPLAFLDRCHHQYGDWFQPRLGNYKELILISDPTAIAEIFNHPENYQSGQANALLRPTLGDNSLLLLDGERHQRQRQLLMPPFHGERMRAYGELISQVTSFDRSDFWPDSFLPQNIFPLAAVIAVALGRSLPCLK